jgi:protein-disulfide isomerase
LKAAEERSKGAEALKRGAMLFEASADLPERGNPDAAITIVEFSDFQCPYCAKATSTVDQVMQEFGDEVRLVYMHLPLESIHPWAMNAAVAATCAAAQDDGAFWKLHDFFFQNQGSINGNNLISKSSNALGGSEIDMTEFAACLDSDSARSIVSEHMKIGQGLGLSGTPAFFVNGRMINGSQPIDHFREAIRLAKMDMLDKS